MPRFAGETQEGQAGCRPCPLDGNQSRQIGGCSRPPVAAVLSTMPPRSIDGRRLVPDLQDGRRALQAELRCSRQRACMPASYQSILQPSHQQRNLLRGGPLCPFFSPSQTLPASSSPPEPLPVCSSDKLTKLTVWQGRFSSAESPSSQTVSSQPKPPQQAPNSPNAASPVPFQLDPAPTVLQTRGSINSWKQQPQHIKRVYEDPRKSASFSTA